MQDVTDSFFSIGKTHTVCQDYARSSNGYGHPYAIISDGCSTSADTDFGARLITTATEAYMNEMCPYHTLGDYDFRIIQDAERAAVQISVSRLCLDATLVAAYRGTDPDGRSGIRVSVRGDGVIVARKRNGDFMIVTFDHEENAPMFLSYDLDNHRRLGYLSRFGEAATKSVYHSDTESWTEVPYVGQPDDQFFHEDDYDLVMVLSDGVKTFHRIEQTDTSKKLVTIPVEEVVPHLLKTKSYTGHFLQRRCQKFFSRHCEREGWQHADDFSAAAIYMEAPSE